MRLTALFSDGRGRTRAIAGIAAVLGMWCGSAVASAGGGLVITGFTSDSPFITLAATRKKCNLVSDESGKAIRCKEARQAIPAGKPGEVRLAVVEDRGRWYRFEIAGSAYWVNKQHVQTNRGKPSKELECVQLTGSIKNPSSTSGAGKDCKQ